jgi:hypothetical protein
MTAMNKKLALQILLLLVGIAHLALGLLANLAPPEMLVKVAALSYGATFEVTPQLHHVIRILGAFMLGVGGLALVAGRDPQRHRTIILGIGVILVLRVVQRVAAMHEVTAAFAIAPNQVWVQAGFFLAIALALFVLTPKATTATPR